MTQKDSFFTIGSSHKVCQDYALSGEKEGATYALVGDGCSSSPNTDVGVRILLHLTEQGIGGFGLSDVFMGLFESSREIVSNMGLPVECLDSTLLSARYTGEGQVQVEALGDGFIAARRRSGGFDLWKIYFSNNCPNYLRYLYEFPDTLHNLERTVVFWVEGESEKVSHEKLSQESYIYRLSLDPKKYDLICLLSDGAASFQEKKSRETSIAFEALRVEKVIEQVLSVKGAQGEFLVRRCNAFLRKWCQKKNWSHTDDFSTSALFLE